MLPFGAAFSLKLLAFGLFLGGIAMSVFVLGFNRAELGASGRYMLGGMILAYDTLLRGGGAARPWLRGRA